MEAKPGLGDEVINWLQKIKERGDSDAEPGTLSYYFAREGDRIALWEK